MNLEMREIEAFLAVAEELHFGRAAARLGLSAPRVSTLIRVLERRIGTPLFVRTSRTVRLTAPGAHLFGEFRAGYARIERAFTDIRDAANSTGQLIRVGFATTLPEEVPAGLVESFERRCPQIRVVHYGVPTTDLFRWLEGDRTPWQIDVFVTWMPTADSPEPDLGIGPVLHRVPRAVMLPADHPLADRGLVDLEDLADYEIVHSLLPSWYSAAWTPERTRSGTPLALRRMDTRYIEDVVRLVAEQGLAHLTFTSVADAYRRPGIVVLPLIGLPAMPVRPVWSRPSAGPIVERFVRGAVEHAGVAGWQTG